MAKYTLDKPAYMPGVERVKLVTLLVNENIRTLVKLFASTNKIRVSDAAEYLIEKGLSSYVRESQEMLSDDQSRNKES